MAKPDWKVNTTCAITVDKKYMLHPIARGTGKGCHSMGKYAKANGTQSIRLSSAPMQTPALRSTIVAGAILLRDRGLLLPALLLPASCNDCSRFVALARRGPANDAALANSVSERASLDAPCCARIGLDSLCSNMATCFALFCAAGSDSDTASSLCTKGLRRAVFFVLWANWCAGSPPQVLSGASEDRSTLLARWLCSAVSVREREKAKGADLRPDAARSPRLASVSQALAPSVRWGGGEARNIPKKTVGRY